MITATWGEVRRRPGSRPRAVVLLTGVALFVTACTGVIDENERADETLGSGGISPIPTSSPTSPTARAEASSSDAAQPTASSTAPPLPEVGAIAASVDAALRGLAEGQAAVDREQVRAAIERGFSDAGAEAETLEVSIDRTPTGLDVDAIQGSGLIGGECVVGEIREGAVSVTVLPVLATGFCFVGDQR